MKDTPSAPPSDATRGGAGFELRLERGGAYVRLADQAIAPGIRLEALTLQIPDVKFPFNVGQGAGQFRHRLADLVELSVALDPSAADAPIATAGIAAFGIEDPRVAARDGFVEIAGRLSGGPAFTLEAGLLPAGDQGVSLVFHSPRVLGPGPVPSAALPHLARAVLDAAGPEIVPRDPVAPLLRRVLAPRGWKLPRTGDVRLARAAIANGCASIVWDRASAGPALTSGDPDLLAADEGARAFRDAEALVARGDWSAAREAYLAAGGPAAAHPFAAERLLSLLAHEERFHDEALDLAAEWRSRRPGFAAALAAEASVRLARGEEARAARAFAALASGAAERGRVFLALAAAEAAYALPGAAREDALSAVEVALRVRRDHVPALRALRALARAADDREALLRANRRLVAYDADPASKARAHAELGELLLEADPPGARLHLDHALRLAPEDGDALSALARACAAAGEPLRAVRALDRLKELVLARGERHRAAAVAIESGALWEGPLDHAENALLRYREAAELAPSADAHARAARAAEKAGQWAEAADQHAAALAALDLSAPGAAALAARTRIALADVAERLGDAAAAAAHLDKAAALAPEDGPLLRRLATLQRSLGRGAQVIAALDRLAPLEREPAARAAVLAEAAEEALALGLAGDARSRFAAAATADGACRPALLGLARLARERGDAVAERDALERLLPLPAKGAEAAEVLDRLAEARERAGDAGGALEAAALARRADPTPARLETSLRLARRAGGPGQLAPLLAERAREAAEAGDAAAATDAWLERARLLAGANPGEALAALAEARAVSPGDPAILRAQADLAEHAGDAGLALECLRALLAATPGDAPVLEVRAARAALAAGKTLDAKDHAERALARGVAGAAEVLHDILERAGDDAARADVLVRLGRHLEAAQLFERHGDAPRARAALERAAANPATAAQALPRLAEARLAEKDRAGAAEALLAMARLAAGREAAGVALRAYELGGDPAALDVAIDKYRLAPALARRAALRVASDPALALADAEAALAGEGLPQDERAGLLALAARAAAAASVGAAARRHLAAYCEAVPNDDGALVRLAAMHRAAGASADLERILERRLEHAQGTEAAQLRLELSDLLAGRDPARAARLALEALERDPASVAALRALIAPPRAEHVSAAERTAFLERLAASEAATPEEVAAALAARARSLADAGDAAGALAAAREAASRAPEPDDLLELRARLASATGAHAEAARALLARARRAGDRGEQGAADRLAEAGFQALAAGVEGAEEALRAVLPLGPDRETRRAVLEALARIAREKGDAEAELEALPLLVPLLPTGARPPALLRISTLALESKNPGLARASAEEARVLAPRDLAAVDACRAAALLDGDLAAVAERLAEAALLEPASAGTRLLDRARLLAALGRHADADDAYRGALAALPPERALADEHARHRHLTLPARPAAEPVEAFAMRCTEPREAASALRAAAAVALSAGDLSAALRCARRAFARSQGDPAFAGPLLARVLYVMGGASEALVLHRRLLETSFPGVAPEDAVTLCRQAADLAESAGERDLALRALDELLRLRPQEVEAALLRFELDPDRSRAVRALERAAEACRSSRRRALAFMRAGEAALSECADRDLADGLFRRARENAGSNPGLAFVVARRRAAATRAAEGASSPAFLEAIHEAATSAQAAGDRAAARELLEDAIARERERGMFGEAARDLLQLDALAAADGDFAESAARLRAAGALQREAGDLAAATETLRGAYAADPDSSETFQRLEELLRAQGQEAAPLLVELLADGAARARPGAERAAMLVRVADAERAVGADDRAEAALRAALAEVPGHQDAEVRLLALLADARRSGERARLLLERSARLGDGEARTELRREAAAALATSPDPHDRDLAAEAWRAVATARPSDLEAARAAAGLLVGLGRRVDAIPHLAALVDADPDDEAAAAELVEAYATRPLEQAELLVRRAARVGGAQRAARLRRAAEAFSSAGEDTRASAALLDAFAACPADEVAFTEALRDASSDPDRLDAVLSARARAVPSEAASCHRTRGDTLQATGRVEQAIAAYEAALAADPQDAAVLAALASCVADARGDAAATSLDAQIVARAEAAPEAVPAAAEAPSRYRIGLTLSFEGKPARAVPHLERAVSLAPFDPHAGFAWAALAQGCAANGDAAGALAAARARVERAEALGLEEERQEAVADEAALVARLDLQSAPGPSDTEREPPAERMVLESGSEPQEEPAGEPPPPGPETLAAWLASAEQLEREGAPVDEIRAALQQACEADPDSPEPWRARARLETAHGDPLGAARAYLSASIRAEGDEAARTALQAAALFEEGECYSDAARAYRAAVHARPGAVPERVLLAAEALAANETEAAARLLGALAPADLPEETRGAHARKLAWALEAAGLMDEAERARAEVHAAAPRDAEALSRARDSEPRLEKIVLEHADGSAARAGAAHGPKGEEPSASSAKVPPGGPGREIGAYASPSSVPPAPSPVNGAQDLARAGRACMARGDFAVAYERLSLALAREPSDITLARDLSRVAEKLGLHDEYVKLGEVCADAIAAHDPLAAAARYRHFAQVLRDRLGSSGRAAVMLEKALALVPDDPDTRRELIAVCENTSGTSPRALEGWLDLARRDPSDAEALAAAASLCERIAASSGTGAASLLARGRIAASLAAFVSPTQPQPEPVKPAAAIPAELRTRVAAPGATGPLARLLRLLSPWLETLFPADLGRRGVSLEDRLAPGRAPAITAAFDSAAGALSSRQFVTFLSGGPGVEAALENTQPPSVILGAGVATLDDSALAFLSARTLDLLGHGWALVGKFAPKDLGILLELACRFAGGAPPSLGLPPQRAGAFFAVLESQVPATVRAAATQLGAAASQELGDIDPRALAAALRRTANRVALLYAGDPSAALRVLGLLDRRVEAGGLDAAQALTLPDLRDVALFALSDPFLELRAAVLG